MKDLRLAVERRGILLPPLPPRAAALIDEYEELRELGASRTVRMITEVLTILAEDGGHSTGAALVEAIRQAEAYFRATRGAISPAVGNGLDRVLAGLDALASQGVEDVQRFLRQRVAAFQERSRADVAQIARAGADLLGDGATVLTYDYSGTVAAALEAAGATGKRLTIVVPESRTLNGGRPIAERATACGHRVHFIADAVIGSYMPGTDAVFEGVEALLADGSFFGTPGTFSVALLAHHFGVPFYALTETLKIAVDTLDRPPADIPHRWLAEVFNYPGSFARPELVSVESPGLERVPASYVTAYITELGNLPPGAVESEARRMQAERGT